MYEEIEADISSGHVITPLPKKKRTRKYVVWVYEPVETHYKLELSVPATTQAEANQKVAAMFADSNCPMFPSAWITKEYLIDEDVTTQESIHGIPLQRWQVCGPDNEDGSERDESIDVFPDMSKQRAFGWVHEYGKDVVFEVGQLTPGARTCEGVVIAEPVEESTEQVNCGEVESGSVYVGSEFWWQGDGYTPNQPYIKYRVIFVFTQPQ